MFKYLLLLGFLSLTACEATDSLTPKEPVDAFAHKVTGPAFDGHWTSKCQFDHFSNAFVIYTMDFKDKSVTRTRDVYSDQVCTVKSAMTTNKGVFRLSKSYDQGFFEIEYRFSISNGQQTMFENVRLKNGMLYISNFYGGDVEPTIELTPPLTAIRDHAATIGQSVSYLSKTSEEPYEMIYTIQGYDSVNLEWNLIEEIRGSESDITMTKLADPWTSTKFANLMRHCESQGHTREIVTVKAGVFETCKIKKGDGFSWYGNVPVHGLVKVESTINSDRMELQSFTSQAQ